MSLFVAGLAFDVGPVQDDAKIGILLPSTLAAVIGSVVLTVSARPGAPPD